MNFTPNVAVSRDCFPSLFKMPRARQEKVLEFIRRFSERPDFPGINFEKIRDAKGKKLRSVRIDDAYRGIVLHPDSGNTYVLDGRPLDDLEGGEDDLQRYRSLLRGQEPRLEGFGSFDEEADFLAGFLKEIESKGERLKDVCLVVRSRALLERYREALAGRGLPLVKLEAGGPENRDEAGVPPKSRREQEDPLMMDELETRERSLLHVAATRARTHILVTWHGEPSPLLGMKSGAN